MMEKLKFKGTPGPWVPDYKDGVCLGVKKVYFYKPPKVIVDTILPKTLGEYRRQRKKIEANARLIAAAPELLETLQSIVNAIEGYGSRRCDIETISLVSQLGDIVQNAKEVIKKALENEN